MPVVPNTTTTAQLTDVQIRELDIVSRFNADWTALTDIMGIMNPIRKQPGTKLVSSKATIVLQPGDVAEGDEVGLSQATVEPVAYKDLTIKKYRKRVTIEAVNTYGAAIAVRKTDEALLNELKGETLDAFYAFALTGTLTSQEADFQMALAMAVTNAKDKFKKLRLNYSNVVAFVNTKDAGRYLGSVNVSVQTQSGVEYLKNVLGADTVIITSEIPEGKVVATPADNIVLCYIDPSDSNFQELGLEYTTGNDEFNLIGIHKEGVYGYASGDTHAIMGMALWAEYLDGIAVVTIQGN